MRAAIRGTGSYLPERVVDNDEIEQRASDFDRARSGSSLDEWVRDRIGVTSRRWVAPGQGCTDMATRAARAALDDAGLAGADLELIVVSTFTDDHGLPQSVSLVQRDLGSEAKCIQLDAACAGFLDGVAVASGLMTTLGYRNALVVHSEVMSALENPDRFLMQAIFGDGAGAAVLQPAEHDEEGLHTIETFTDGTKADWVHAGGGLLSMPHDVEDLDAFYLMVDNQSVFPFAVEKMASSLRSVVERDGRALDEVDWVIAHQAGVNITRGVAEDVGIDPDRFLMTLDHTGNTSGATIPIALDHFNRLGTLAEGDYVVFPAVGAGMTWGAASCTWSSTAAGRAARDARVERASEPLTVP